MKTNKEPLSLWNVEELEMFFKKEKLLIKPVKLNGWTTITDIKLFIKSSLATVKAHNGIETFRPYFDRLHSLFEILKNSYDINSSNLRR
jgi:hypothetical protein